MAAIGIKSGLVRTAAAAPLNALRFPSNIVESKRMRLLSSNLLSFSPATYIWEVTPQQQTGYYTTFFWANDSGSTFSSGQTYVGFHPYPYEVGVGPTSSSGTIHHWEISVNGDDTPITKAGLDDNGNSTLVVKNVKYVQAATVVVSGSNYVMTYYWSLPTTTKVISYTFATSNYSLPPTPALVIGGNAWAPTSENLSGDLQRFKAFSSVLTLSDISSEAADLTRLVTSSGSSNIWFGKKNWASNTDLTCDYGTGHTLAWADTGNKAVLVGA